MKKIFMMMALMAMTLTASAQDAELKTYDCKPFTCQYPADYEADEDPFFDTMFSAEKDETHKMQMSLNDQKIASLQAFKAYTENIKKVNTVFLGEPTGWKVDAPVYKGMTMTIRRVKEEEYDEAGKVMMVAYDFASVGSKTKRLFAGIIRYPLSEDAKYKPLIDKIVASIKEK